MPATAPAQVAEEMTAKLVSALKPAMTELGKDIQSDMRQLISVPVQYVGGDSAGAKPSAIGSRSAPGLTQRDVGADGIHYTTVNGKRVKVVRSKPGEPPRKEFGFLYKSMRERTTAETLGLTTQMWSDDGIAGYAGFLENQLRRPHFGTIFLRVRDYAVSRILSRLPKNI